MSMNPNSKYDYQPSVLPLIAQDAAGRISAYYEKLQDQKGPDTYLNGHAHGWPQDHSVDDAYDVPLHIIEEAYKASNPVWCPAPEPTSADLLPDSEYTAEFRGDGSAVLVLYTSKIIAKFDTFADAQLAAEALNNLKGY